MTLSNPCYAPPKEYLHYYNNHEVEESARTIAKMILEKEPEHVLSLFQGDGASLAIQSHFTFLEKLEPDMLFERHAKTCLLDSYEDMVKRFSQRIIDYKKIQPYEKAWVFYDSCLKSFHQGDIRDKVALYHLASEVFSRLGSFTDGIQMGDLPPDALGKKMNIEE